MSSQNNILNMQTLTGITLVVFAFTFGTLVLFGLLNTVTDNGLTYVSLNLFKELYFVLVAAILGVIYVYNTDNNTSKMAHVFILLSILVLSASSATLAGSAKSLYDMKSIVSEVNQLQAQNAYYSQYAQSLADYTDMVHSQNLLLQNDLQNLTEILNNRQPVIVETFVESPIEPVQTPTIVFEDYDEEDDYEDD